MLRIWLWRKLNHFSQVEAAHRIGIDLTALRLIEQGRLTPSRRQIELFRAYFGDQTDMLLSEATISSDAAN